MSSKKSMEEVSVAELIGKYNMIVPEIQREYVWGINKNSILDTFIQDVKSGVKESNLKKESSNSGLDALKGILGDAEDDITRQKIAELIVKLNVNMTNMNIGFLYSYKPDYYVFNDNNEDVYLIDGQQRFTTLFLMLFYFSIKENRRDEFVELFRFNAELEQIAFDYRVRTLTHNFLIDLIGKTEIIADLEEIGSKNWFLSNYKKDVTIKSIVGNPKLKQTNGLFPVLNQSFSNDNCRYFDYLKNQVKFWHFKAEETTQGEELYITMNSRGQQLADNETIRAFLFDQEQINKTGKNEIYWSEQWETWQDFFWKKRDKTISLGASADVGFNEFLRWVQIITMTSNQTQITDDEDENAPDKKAIVEVIKWDGNKKLNSTFLGLNEIEWFYKALCYLFVDFPIQLKDLKVNYKYYKNFDLINIEWLRPKDSVISQLDCFKFIPVLFYCKKRLESGDNIDAQKLFRIIRFLYNLSKNETISKTASVQCINALKMIDTLETSDDIIDLLHKKTISASILNSEENKKLNYLKETNRRTETEDCFWDAEDIEQNDGEISHLIELTEKVNTETITFDLEIFIGLLKAYKRLLKDEDLIWGDFFNSNVYDDSNYRVTYHWDYHKRSGFLSLTQKWYEYKVDNMEDFLLDKRKNFIKQYASAEEIALENSPKKQLYIYYILQTCIVNKAPQWSWYYGYNFGCFNKYNGASSIFSKGNIFQQYNNAWRENENKIIWMQKDMKNAKKKLDELIAWSNQ